MLSEWHVHAKDYAREARRHPEMQITVVWDNDPERGQAFATTLGVPFESDLDVTLSRPDVDAVIVDTPTNLHKDVIIAAAKAGKHIFTEKVLAITLAEAREIATAVQESGVKFAISFPHRTLPHNLLAKKMIDEGLLGEVSLLRIRNAHAGAVLGWLPPHFYDLEACGGGAMIDLGAHGMYLPLWLLGKPKGISATFTNLTDKAVEDNAVAVLEYANGAIAINETGFVTPYSPFSLEIYGSEGSFLYGGPEQKVQITSKHLITKDYEGWLKPRLPQALPSAMTQWVDAILHEGTIHFTLDDAISLTEIMEGAYRSHKSGQKVQLPFA